LSDGGRRGERFLRDLLPGSGADTAADADEAPGITRVFRRLLIGVAEACSGFGSAARHRFWCALSLPELDFRVHAAMDRRRLDEVELEEHNLILEIATLGTSDGFCKVLREEKAAIQARLDAGQPEWTSRVRSS
jgi:hypothetical protein